MCSHAGTVFFLGNCKDFHSITNINDHLNFNFKDQEFPIQDYIVNIHTICLYRVLYLVTETLRICLTGTGAHQAMTNPTAYPICKFATRQARSSYIIGHI